MKRYVGRSKLIRPNELVVCVGSAIALGILFERLDAFERLAGFLAEHEAWQLDEYFFMLIFGGVGALILAIRRSVDLALEIGQREAAEARATSLARHDPLTGLVNRRMLHEELPGLLEEARNSTRQCAVFMIDLDHFKPINDVFGHDTGDAVLVEVASRLQRVASGHGLAARVGGDEFVLTMLHDPGTDAPARTAAQIIRALSSPYEVGGRKLELGATVGIDVHRLTQRLATTCCGRRTSPCMTASAPAREPTASSMPTWMSGYAPARCLRPSCETRSREATSRPIFSP
ncbi:GGDEF domain-containing protein [Sphingomonas sp. JC676]|uniref:diguanylate cyclase domain-containing protein n=1 Tax=Sphingomonas sp. JC676 TaxID=2768065 RepID=UPI00165838F1|nr:GGDEF domain-containing protein [Sphingomonas sp. JC676]MBC9032249.1 GGDEF domain-containing protein [Sphingomonas sp. JC676]